MTTTTITMTIGWTLGVDQFVRGYQPGMDQHIESFDVECDGDVDRKLPVDVATFLAERAFVATNHPDPEGLTGLAGTIYEAVKASGYNGAVEQGLGHYSLSVGDTVTIRYGAERPLTVACASYGWEVQP